MKPPKDYFKHQKDLLKILGISLQNTKEKRSIYYKTYSFFVISILIIWYGILEVYEAVHNFSNVDVFVRVVSFLATDLLGLIKLFILVYYRKEISEMLDSFEAGCFLPDLNRGGEYEIKILKKYVSFSNYQAYIYEILCMMVILSGMFGTISERISNPNDSTKWTMPFLSFSLFQIDRSPNYEIAWFVQSTLRIIFSGIVSALDTLLGAILANITAQCLILQNNIRRITINTNENEVFFKLKHVVHYHWEILNLAKKFDHFFSYLLLSEFFATLGILCLTMYHASLSDLFSRKAAQDFSYVVTISMQIFLCCYWGNEVTVESENIAIACTEADFVGGDVRFQKSLVFLIQNCQKPIILTAGNFTKLSLKTFVWILRASYSYYMVLRSTNYN